MSGQRTPRGQADGLRVRLALTALAAAAMLFVAGRARAQEGSTGSTPGTTVEAADADGEARGGAGTGKEQSGNTAAERRTSAVTATPKPTRR